MVDINELYENKHFEIDDVHHAAALISGSINVQAEAKVIYLARMLAVLRQHYVKVGGELERSGNGPDHY